MIKNITTKPLITSRVVVRKFLALMCAVLFAGSSFAQQGTVKVSANNMTAKRALSEIETQTGKVFGISEHFDVLRNINFNKTELPLSEAVNKIIGKNFTARYYQKYILIYHKNLDKGKERALRYVAGTILDVENKPLKNTTVEILGRENFAVTTDESGNFHIANIPEGRHIVKITPASGEGVQYKEIVVGPGSSKVEMIYREYAPKTEAYPGRGNGHMEIEDVTHYPTEAKPAVTYYYNDKADVDETIKAANGSAMDYSYVPSENLYNGYKPKVGIKTNFIWWATTSPNFAAEFYLAKKWTLDASVVYNPWKFGSEKSHRFWLVQPEVRYWFCRSFEKHFIGVHGIYGKFNIGNSKLPFTDKFDEYKYKGTGYGAGISYGYHMPIGKRWGMEFTLGAGYVHLDYKKYRCSSCDEYEGKHDYNYFGVTKAGISLIFLIR